MSRYPQTCYQPYCNGCKKRFTSGRTGWKFSSTCGHILCTSCAGSDRFKCNMCGKEGNIYPSGQVPRSLFEFFCDPIKLVERAERIRKYQAFQMNEYIKHLEEERSRLKRLLTASRKQTAFWKGMVPQDKIIQAYKKIKRDIKQERVDEGFIDLASSIRSGRSQESFDPALLGGVDWDEPMEENMNSSEMSYNNSLTQQRSCERLPIMNGTSDSNIMRDNLRSRIYRDPTRVLSTQPALPSTQMVGRSFYPSMNRF